MPRRFLICYDIADDKRLRQLQRYVSAHALMIHYSVYLAEATDAEIAAICEGIRARIDPDADDVRIYTLTGRTAAWAMGVNAATVAPLLAGKRGLRHGWEEGEMTAA